MVFVERHIINPHHSYYKECDALCIASRNIHNLFCDLADEIGILKLIKREVKKNEIYSTLPIRIAKQTLKYCIRRYEKGYLRKLTKFNDRLCVLYPRKYLSQKVYEASHKLKLHQSNIEFYTKIEDFESIKYAVIKPVLNYYIIEVYYSIRKIKEIEDNNKYCSIDLGVNNLATVTSNTKNFKPFIINGKPIKSVNQFYNKKMKKYRGKLISDKRRYKSSKRIKRICNKRTNKINDYFHKASNLIVKKIVENDINTLIIGKNDGWKKGCNLGNVNNQNFIYIPHSRFVEMLRYKCEVKGIRVIVHEEKYTSKCSFLDNESIEYHEKYAGRRIRRGLFMSANKTLINADVNGSYNIMRKVVPNAFAEGIEGVMIHPLIITIKNNNH